MSHVNVSSFLLGFGEFLLLALGRGCYLTWAWKAICGYNCDNRPYQNTFARYIGQCLEQFRIDIGRCGTYVKHLVP